MWIAEKVDILRGWRTQDWVWKLCTSSHTSPYAALHLYPNKMVTLSISLSSVSCSGKLNKPRERTVGTLIYSCLVRSTGKTNWVFWVTSCGQSCGTECSTCWIWYCIQADSTGTESEDTQLASATELTARWCKGESPTELVTEILCVDCCEVRTEE